MPNKINIVCNADQKFVVPLTVMLSSLLRGCSVPDRVSIHVLDGGIHEVAKRKIQGMVAAYGSEIFWLTPDIENIACLLKESGHISRSAYLRIFSPDILPLHIAKALYLDCDIVILGDICELWAMQLPEGSLILANQDLGCPLVSSPHGLKHYARLGYKSDTPYFCSGLMVMDLDAWRRDKVTTKAIDYVRQFSEDIQWHDQDILNAVLAGQWQTLPLKWHQTAALFYRTAGQWGMDPDVYECATKNPKLIHFSTASKPWHLACRHPARALWWKHLQQTPFWNLKWMIKYALWRGSEAWRWRIAMKTPL